MKVIYCSDIHSFTPIFRIPEDICWKKRVLRNQSCSYILWEAGSKMMMCLPLPVVHSAASGSSIGGNS
jgi:hypothetical protein